MMSTMTSKTSSRVQGNGLSDLFVLSASRLCCLMNGNAFRFKITVHRRDIRTYGPNMVTLSIKLVGDATVRWL
jgi:hypothetical protein